MTTGTRTSGSSAVGPYYYKTWSGTDGRYVPGTAIIKQNPWTCTIVRGVKTHGLQRISMPPPPNALPPCNVAYAIAANYNMPTKAQLFTNNDQLALLAKLTDFAKQSKFNLAVFTALGDKLTSQTVSTITALARSMRSLKRGDISSALKYLGMTPGQRKKKFLKKKLSTGDISGTWLAMQYGWLPAIADVFAAAEAYAALTQKERVMTVTVSKKGRSIHYNGSGSAINYTCPGIADGSIRLTYTLKENISVARSLGLTNPASVLHELTPFSFVLDWFLPIGTYLETLSVIPVLKGNFVSTARYRWNASGMYRHPFACQPATVKYSQVTFERTVGSVLKVPTPVFVQGLGGKRIFNAVALGHQLLRNSAK